MINFDDYANENKSIYNKNWPLIPYVCMFLYILIIRGSGSFNNKRLSFC